jgi:hypothetical protein
MEWLDCDSLNKKIDEADRKTNIKECLAGENMVAKTGQITKTMA